jgi:glucose/arabinose dehydrogenase
MIHTRATALLAGSICVASLLTAAAAASAQTAPAPAGAAPAGAPQLSIDPFSTPIEAAADVINVDFVEFAVIPDAGKDAPRLMHLVDEPATKRIFVSTMQGLLYSVSYDGKTVTPYLDINASTWTIGVQFENPERGLQSFAFHPEFNQRGARGFGKFYTYVDTTNTTATPDFTAAGAKARTHDTVLLEWTAKDPAAAAYDGGAPREIFRAAHPFGNHNGGEIAFRPVKQGQEDYGLLYVGFADGGSGGDPFKLGQNMSSAFGKILRIDPMGTNSANGKYGIPASNPFMKKPAADTLKEIYASGVRNPQRFSWDAKTGRMYLADIGQNVVEEISPVTAGANLGWNKWEASFAFTNQQVDMAVKPRSEAGMTWPVVEYDHRDPLLAPTKKAAITGVYVYRSNAIKQLANLLIFGDNPNGEIFYVHADKLPAAGGQAAIRRILLNDKGTPKPLLQIIRDKNTAQGKTPADRADLRLGQGPQGQIFVMNKRDGVIRLLVPNGQATASR